MKKTDEQTLEEVMKEGFESLRGRLERMEIKLEGMDTRLQRMEWSMMTYKRGFEVLHGFSAQHDEDINELRHQIRRLSPSAS